MSSLLGGLEKLGAQSTSQAIGFGLGFALGHALTPEGELLAQGAWKELPINVPITELLAVGVAQGQVDPGQAAEWAKLRGYDTPQWNALVSIANTGPALGYAYQAWRRGLLSDAEFETALRRTGLETQWNDAMRGLKTDLLEPGALATAIHRGIIAGRGLLIREPPLGAGRIPHVEQSELDPLEEAAGQGITRERLRILVGNTGLPLSLGEMLRLLNMGEVEPDDVRRSIAQSNVRNEYMDAALALRRRLLTPHEYVEARVRGWISTEEMHAGAALSGVERDDTDLLFKVTGRPLSFRQVFIGERRGGRYDGPTEQIDPAFLKALQESNVRPEWYHLAWAQRYSYPSAFVLRQLAASGELTEAEAREILLYEGWEPVLAAKVAKRWAGGGSSAGKQATQAELGDEYEGGYITETEYRAALATLGYGGASLDHLVHLGDARRVKRYREKVVDAIAAAYLAFKLDATQATSELGEANVTGEAARLLLRLWDLQRRDTVSLLTVAQVKKAYGKGLFSREAALAELEHREYAPADAATILDE